MYDGKSISLPNLFTYEERLKYIKENIFNKEHYRIYYGFTNENEKLDNDFTNRWLGMKKENSDSINYQVRNTINYLTTYLTNAKEFSTDHLIKKYLILKKKFENNSINDKEIKDYNNLCNNVLYIKVFPRRHNKEIIIFYVNDNVENIFKNKELKEKLKECQQIKDDVIKYSDKIKELNKENDNLFKFLQQEYQFMKETKDKQEKSEIMNTINKYILKLKEVENEIIYLEMKISGLCSDYKYLTEYK